MVGDPQQRRRAILGRSLPPTLERLLGCGNRGLELRRACLAYLRDHRAARGIEDRLDRAFASHQATAD